MSPVASAHSTLLSQTKKGFERLKTEFLSFFTPHDQLSQLFPLQHQAILPCITLLRGFTDFCFFIHARKGSKAQEEAAAISEALYCPLKH